VTLSRNKPLPPGSGFQRKPGSGLKRVAFPSGDGCITGSRAGISLAAGSPARRAAARKPLRPVSAKRARENRQRRQMVTDLYPERPHCARPGCPRMADDLHEPLTRARGGSITDEANQVPLCRPCHDEVTFRPESELQWAYDAGLLVHSWDAS
jgi:hypothetical protein